MSCLCATTTLKIFVRSVVQLEIGTANLPSTASARSSSVRQWRQNRTSTSLLSSRVAFGRGRDFSTFPAQREAEEGKNGNTTDDDKAVAGLSTQSIDELVAELNSEKGSASPYAEGADEQPRQPQRREGGPLVRKTYAEDGQHAGPIRTRRPSRADSDLAGRQREKKGDKTKDTDGRGGKEVSKPRKDDWTPPPRAHWQIDKAALKAKFPDGWAPHRRLSPDALAGIRALHAQMPTEFTTAALANRFQVSPEAIRRILKSKWTPNAEEETDRARRWIERGKKVYEKHVAEGGKAPKRWREMGVGVGAGRRARERARRKREAVARERNGDDGAGRKRVLPALVTTARKREGFGKGRDGDGLEGRIL